LGAPVGGRRSRRRWQKHQQICGSNRAPKSSGLHSTKLGGRSTIGPPKRQSRARPESRPEHIETDRRQTSRTTERRISHEYGPFAISVSSNPIYQRPDHARGCTFRRLNPAGRVLALSSTITNDGSDGEQQPNALPCWPLQECGSANASSMGVGSADTGRPLDRIWFGPKCGNSRS
jgi:hypothetical protein